MLVPLGLFFLCMDWTRRGSRDEELLLIVPGVLFALGVAMLFPFRARAKEGETSRIFFRPACFGRLVLSSFLAGAAMVSIVVLLADAQRNDRDEYIFYGYVLLFLNSAYLFIRGCFLRVITEEARLFIRRWTPRMGVVLVLLLLAWVERLVGQAHVDSAQGRGRGGGMEIRPGALHRQNPGRRG